MANYLRITAQNDNTLIKLESRVSTEPYYFAKDTGVPDDQLTWEPGQITLNAGESCFVKGSTYPAISVSDYKSFSFSDNVAITGGSIMSLVDGTGESTEITQAFGFTRLFMNCSQITSIHSELLSATTLIGNCYKMMFRSCTGLTSLPEKLLPATALAAYCYGDMFTYCSGLTSLPEKLLPATNLETYCYQSMFGYCEGLTSLPEKLLPATTLANGCYQSMFGYCKGLTSIPENFLPSNTLPAYCYQSMFGYCESLTSLPKKLLHAPSVNNSAYDTMFKKCTSLTKAYIGASFIGIYAINYMFLDCSSLKEIHVNIKEWRAYNGWVSGVAVKGSFYAPVELEKIYDVNHVPVNWDFGPESDGGRHSSITFCSRVRAAAI